MENDRFLNFFNNFYALLQEANFFKNAHELSESIQDESDSFINEQLKIIRRHRVRIIAKEKREKIQQLSTIIEALKNDEIDHLTHLLGKEHTNQAFALYNNFKEKSDKDDEAIIQERLYLALIEMLESSER